MAKVVSRFHTLTGFGVAEAEAGTDAPILASEVVEALAAEADSDAVVRVSEAVETLVFGPTGEGCLQLVATLCQPCSFLCNLLLHGLRSMGCCPSSCHVLLLEPEALIFLMKEY
jgi:hypothetical protein